MNGSSTTTRPASRLNAGVLIILVVALTAVPAGCRRSQRAAEIPAEVSAAMQDYVGYVSQLATVLSEVSDAASAKAAVAEVDEAVAGMARTKAVLDAISVRQRVRLELRYEDQIATARVRVNQEAIRLLSKQPTALVLRAALAEVPTLIR